MLKKYLSIIVLGIVLICIGLVYTYRNKATVAVLENKATQIENKQLIENVIQQESIIEDLNTIDTVTKSVSKDNIEKTKSVDRLTKKTYASMEKIKKKIPPIAITSDVNDLTTENTHQADAVAISATNDSESARKQTFAQPNAADIVSMAVYDEIKAYENALNAIE